MPLFRAPTQLSRADKDALIAALTVRLATADQRIAAQDARIAALEARLNELSRPPKTPTTHRSRRRKGRSRPGVGRTLHPNPDRTIDQRLTTCPKCEAISPDASQTPQQIYERIELPPIRPNVTQVRCSAVAVRFAVSG